MNFQISMKTTGLVSILIFLWTATSQAQETAVPVEVQFPLFLKILTFDRNLKARVGDEIVIGIVHQSRFRTSLNVKDDFVDVMNRSPIKKVKDIPVRQVPIDIDKSNLGKAISKNKVDILYITPVRALGMEKIAGVSRARKVITLTGIPDYIKSGLAVGIGVKGGKPWIIINLPAAKAEGANFSSRLLILAKVIMK